MIDINKENGDISTAVAESGAAPAPAQNPPTAPQPEMSKGERWYNWLVYKGLNYWANLLVSIYAIEFFTKRGGREPIDRAAHRLGNLFGGKSAAANDLAYHHSKTLLDTLSTLTGGWLLVVPLKILEDHKRGAVHWLNKKLGVNQTAADGHEMTKDEIYIEEEQPKQSWARAFGRRALATGVVLSIGHAVNGIFRDRSKPMPGRGEIDHFGGKERITNYALGGKEKARNAHLSNLAKEGGVNLVLRSGYFPWGKKLANNTRVQNWLQAGVLDSVFTAITAAVMWATNGAKKEKMPQEIGENGVPVVASPATADMETTATSPDKEALEKFKSKKPIAADSYIERINSEPQPSLQAGI